MRPSLPLLSSVYGASKHPSKQRTQHMLCVRNAEYWSPLLKPRSTVIVDGSFGSFTRGIGFVNKDWMPGSGSSVAGLPGCRDFPPRRFVRAANSRAESAALPENLAALDRSPTLPERHQSKLKVQRRAVRERQFVFGTAPHRNETASTGDYGASSRAPRAVSGSGIPESSVQGRNRRVRVL